MQQNEPIVIKHLLEHREMLFAFVLALVRDHDAAEEIFQTVGVKVVVEAQRGTAPEDFAKWARGIARHCVADYFRERQQRQQVLAQAALSGSLADRIEQAFDEQHAAQEDLQHRLRHLKDCVHKLSARAQQLLALRYERRLPIEDVAAEVNWTPASVKVALSRARTALADCMKRHAAAGGAE